MTETKQRSLVVRSSSTAPALRTPSAAAMGAASALSMFVAFLRWFFFGSVKNDLYGIALGGTPPVLSARQALGNFLLIRLGFLILVASVVGWALAEPLVASLLIGGSFVLAAAWFVARARARFHVIRAATRSLDDGPALEFAHVTAPALFPSRALGLLAVATDAARRGDVGAAGRAADAIDEAFLEPDEQRLLWGVRALVADRASDRGEAARFGLMAFPVGAPDIDERLGRIFAQGNWHDATRLSRAFDEWVAQGFEPSMETPIGRLLLLIDLKLCRRDMATLAADARTLEAEARALGDGDLAETIRNEARPLPDSRYR